MSKETETMKGGWYSNIGHIWFCNHKTIIVLYGLVNFELFIFKKNMIQCVS